LSGLDQIIIDLALVLITAGVTTIVFKKIKQPVVLGYIVVGFLVSSNFKWFPAVHDFEHIHIWAEIGIVFLMFALGLEFSLQKLTKLGSSVIVTTLTAVSAMIVVGFAAGELMGWSNMDSIFLGGMICVSSTMIILKAFEEYGLKTEKFASHVLGILIFEDLVAIFIMIILSTLAVSREVSGFDLLFQISILLLYLVLWIALGIYLIPTILKRVRSFMNDETLLIASIGLCLGMVVLANFIGFSSALGAFIAGSILAGTTMAESIETMVKPIKDLFGAVFFVSVGMMVVPDMVIEYIVPILILTATVIIGQMLFSLAGTLLSGHSLHTAVRTGFSLVQIGEFSFIIASLGSSLKVTSDFLYPIAVCVSVFTTFLTPVMIKNAEPVYSLLCKILPDKTVNFLDRYTSEKRSDSDKDEDWTAYITKYLIRTVICTAALFAVYILASKLAVPLIHEYILQNTWAMVLEFVFIVSLMAPFISMMCSGRKKFLFAKLWLKSPTNRLPLLALNGIRVALAIFFIMLTFNKIYTIPVWLLLLLAVILIIIIERTDFTKSAVITIETRFMANYNENTLENAAEREGAAAYGGIDEELVVAQFDVSKITKNNDAREFYAKKVFGIFIIKIIRGGETIYLPRTSDKVRTGDTVFILGNKPQIESYISMLEKYGEIANAPTAPIRLKEFLSAPENIGRDDRFVCCVIKVTRKSPLNRKTIKNSKFRKAYDGYIIGIRRGRFSITDIKKDMIIYEDDFLWILGMQGMAPKLAADGLLAV